MPRARTRALRSAARQGAFRRLPDPTFPSVLARSVPAGHADRRSRLCDLLLAEYHRARSVLVLLPRVWRPGRRRAGDHLPGTPARTHTPEPHANADLAPSPQETFGRSADLHQLQRRTVFRMLGKAHSLVPEEQIQNKTDLFLWACTRGYLDFVQRTIDSKQVQT